MTLVERLLDLAKRTNRPGYAEAAETILSLQDDVNAAEERANYRGIRIHALEQALRAVASVDEFVDGTSRLCWCRMPSQWATKDSGHETDCETARALLNTEFTAKGEPRAE